MAIEDIEDVYILKNQAEQVQPFLQESTYRFENYVDNFKHTNENECETTGSYVSEGMIASEAAHYVDVIETHEVLLEDLKEAVDKIPECQSHRYIDGERIRKENLERELTGLIEDYEDSFDEVIRVCGRATLVEDIPGPQEVRSKRNEREAQRDLGSQSFDTNAVRSFFAD